MSVPNAQRSARGRSRIDNGFASATRTSSVNMRRKAQLAQLPSLTESALNAPGSRRSSREAQVMPVMQPSKNKRRQLQLNDLECIKAIGEGGWAKVFLVQSHDTPAHHSTGCGVLFALKSIEKRFYRDNERNDDREDRVAAAERRNQEIRCLATLPWNAFVAGIVDAYTDPRNAYLMLEFAAGGSLHDYMREHGALSYDMAEFYFANIVLGIEFLHTHGVVHRDIKDENILIGADGYLMITDFGLSQFVDEGERWGRLGTTPFLSYEVAKKNNDSIEARFASDWWGAAVILFEMLADCLPFSGRDYDSIAEDHERVRIQFPKGNAMPQNLQEFFKSVFKCDLNKRLGARTELRYKNGSRTMCRLNLQFREHEWLGALKWDRIEKRIELAPYLPDRTSCLTQEFDDPPMPEQRKVPGLRLKRHWDCFEHEHDNADAVHHARRKRQRVATQSRVPDTPAVSAYRGPPRAAAAGGLVLQDPSSLDTQPGSA